MKEFFKLTAGQVEASDPRAANVVVYTLPGEEEKQDLLESLHLDPHALESALDQDEISRLECLQDDLYVIWKRPNNTSFSQQFKLEVSSIGLYLQKNRLTVILSEGIIPFKEKEFQGAATLPDLLLRILQHTIHHFLGHLKAIKQLTGEIQTKLNASLGNQYLLQMFTLGENLIYYIDALESNHTVLTKLHKEWERIGFSRSELGLMEDIAIEHNQCAKQAEIYSTVLSGLMDARASIINNNMNRLLKDLTIINIVFLPLNLIAGIGGMSEYTEMAKGMNLALAYVLLCLGMALLGWAIWLVLRRTIK
ncbi:MAG TPA: magnesium transporter CorA family protein [bacterium]|nr:magnesium transporter CorA family protein [bacterium]